MRAGGVPLPPRRPPGKRQLCRAGRARVVAGDPQPCKPRCSAGRAVGDPAASGDLGLPAALVTQTAPPACAYRRFWTELRGALVTPICVARRPRRWLGHRSLMLPKASRQTRQPPTSDHALDNMCSAMAASLAKEGQFGAAHGGKSGRETAYGAAARSARPLSQACESWLRKVRPALAARRTWRACMMRGPWAWLPAAHGGSYGLLEAPAAIQDPGSGAQPASRRMEAGGGGCGQPQRQLRVPGGSPVAMTAGVQAAACWQRQAPGRGSLHAAGSSREQLLCRGPLWSTDNVGGQPSASSWPGAWVQCSRAAARQRRQSGCWRARGRRGFRHTPPLVLQGP